MPPTINTQETIHHGFKSKIQRVESLRFSSQKSAIFRACAILPVRFTRQTIPGAWAGKSFLRHRDREGCAFRRLPTDLCWSRSLDSQAAPPTISSTSRSGPLRNEPGRTGAPKRDMQILCTSGPKTAASVFPRRPLLPRVEREMVRVRKSANQFRPRGKTTRSGKIGTSIRNWVGAGSWRRNLCESHQKMGTTRTIRNVVIANRCK